MFTGIVKGSYPISQLDNVEGILHYAVDLDKDLVRGLEFGASVSIDGACQTVVAIKNNTVCFHAVEETLQRTHFSQLYKGQLVNVERSLRFGDEVGGHVLSGHVFCTGRVKKVIGKGAAKDLLIVVPMDCADFLNEKGFIAINGVSLTIGKVDASSFYLHLIPETLSITNLDALKVGDLVNVEFDQQTVSIVNTVKRYLKKQPELS